MSAEEYQREKRAWKVRRDAMLRLLAKGLSQAEVGRRFGVSRARVNQIILQERSK